MSSQQQFAASGGGAPPRSDKIYPDCPKCSRRMTLKQVSPVLFASDMDDVIYGCEACGTETKRTVRRT